MSSRNLLLISAPSVVHHRVARWYLWRPKIHSDSGMFWKDFECRLLVSYCHLVLCVNLVFYSHLVFYRRVVLLSVYLVYFSAFWYVVGTKKNLATLVQQFYEPTYLPLICNALCM
jgi:hypothetical protein